MHDIAHVSKNRPVELFIQSELTAAEAESTSVFRLLCHSRDEVLELEQKLQSLVDARDGGHQYFALDSTRATLMVSVGEYDD